ncbi:hypothetical protein AB2B41_02070 [Marimonas sp. MJW-29]|uniref:Uncharacterized protein n=1 Tax=Sulfitobacter sediminis TaxID=3234186 RepID=A0ABV3RHD9_9RHOB
MLRSLGRQVLLSLVVLSAVFAAGFLAGSSSSLSKMQAECMTAEGNWSGSFCTVAGASK